MLEIENVLWTAPAKRKTMHKTKTYHKPTPKIVNLHQGNAMQLKRK